MSSTDECDNFSAFGEFGEWGLAAESSDVESNSGSDDDLHGLDERADAATTFVCATLNVGLGIGRKLSAVLRRAAQLRADFVALQEIGDGADLSDECKQYDYRIVTCRHKHAGVALLVRSKWWPFVRQPLTSGTDGRLTGVILDFNGTKLAVISAYMPTGLDNCSSDSESALLAVDLYARLLRWKRDTNAMVLMGDLNETMTPQDRTGRSAHRGRFVANLVQDGCRDAFRVLSNSNGFTYKAPLSEGRETFSRIDYVFCSGLATPEACKLDPWTGLTRHRQLIVAASVPMQVVASKRAPRVKLPDMRRASAEQRRQFAQAWESKIDEQRQQLVDWSAGTEADMNTLADFLSSSAMAAAKQTLPFTGQRPFCTAAICDLIHERRVLSQLRACVRQIEPMELQASERWKSCSRKAARFVKASWSQPWLMRAHWELGISDRIRVIRRMIKIERSRLKARADQRGTYNPMAFLHRTLRGDKESALDSVVDPASNDLVTDGTGVKSVLRGHFANVFRSASEGKRAPKPRLESTAFAVKRDVDPAWYHELMAPFMEVDVLALLKESPWVVAPGSDGVSSGLLRAGAENSNAVRWALALLLNACLRLRRYPNLGRHSIIVPILKKPQAERLLSNVRPISLQAAISKLLSKGMAGRLNAIFAHHRILSEAAEGFLLGGSTTKCVDVVLDAVEQAIADNLSFFAIFYDVKSAYDAVEHAVLLQCLRRIRLPEAFVELIADSLRALTSSVRTAYGDSEPFPVSRSVRQGDPASPVLFVILKDSMHALLEQLTLAGSRVGAVIGSSSIPSKGYADDSAGMSNTLQGIERINDSVASWCADTLTAMSPSKTKGMARLHGDRSWSNDSVRISGDLIGVLKVGEAFNYLGALITADLNWKQQISAIGSTVGYYCMLARKQHLPVASAVLFFNAFLFPKVEPGLRHAVIPTATLESWDVSISRTISALAGTPVRCMKREAIACVTGLRLFAKHYAVVQVSETFIRLNGNDQAADTARSRWRTMSTDSLRENRLVHVRDQCKRLDLELRGVDAKRWRCEEWNAPTGTRVLSMTLDGQKFPLVFNFIGTWGKLRDKRTAICVIESSNKQWAVCFASDFVRDNAANARLKADVLQSGKCASGDAALGSLECCVHVLMACPASWTVKCIVAESAARAWSRWQTEASSRRKLRMHGRPVFGLLERVVSARRDVGGSCSITFGTSAGAEVLCAKLARKRLTTAPDPVQPLNLELGERHVALFHAGQCVVHDVRAMLAAQAKRECFSAWRESKTQAVVACEEAADWFKDVCQQRWRGGDRFAMRLVTDTLHFEHYHDDGKTAVRELRCDFCNAADDVAHLTSCQAPATLDLHRRALENLQHRFAEFGTVKAEVRDCQGLEELLKFGGRLSAAVRCGILPSGFWRTMKLNIWTEIEGNDAEAMRLELCKVLFELMFAIWETRHDASVFL
jgi:exonuclease III